MQTLEQRYSKYTRLPGYETVFIIRNEVADDTIKALKEKIQGIVESFGGQWVHQETWGKRKLAYPIEKETRGHYEYFVYTGKPGVVAEIERHLRLNEKIMRFLTVNLDKEFDVEAFKKKAPAMSLRLEDTSARFEGRDRGDRYDRYDRGYDKF